MAVASRQRGCVARAQLDARGLTKREIQTLVAAGHLIRVHRGVYLVGHRAPVPFAREQAALLAGGQGATLAGRAAAHAHGFAPSPPTTDLIVGSSRRDRANLRFRAPALAGTQRTMRHGLAVTTATRTLADLRHARDFAALRDGALAVRAVTPAGLRLAGLLDDHADGFTRSEAERRLVALLRAAALPSPRLNARVGGYEVDAVWPDRRLVVEVDGHRFHSSRSAFEDDRRRDADLQAAGWRVLRFTWRRLTGEPHVVVARVAAALALSSAA